MGSVGRKKKKKLAINVKCSRLMAAVMMFVNVARPLSVKPHAHSPDEAGRLSL